VLHGGYHFKPNGQFKLNDGHFKKFLSLHIVEITINNIDLTSVSDELFARLVNSCKECKISLQGSLNILEPNKWGAIFNAMRKGTKLKTFALSWEGTGVISVSQIPVGILAQAFSKLESLSLKSVQFGENQLKTICESLTGSSNMKYLELQDIGGPKSDLVCMNMLDAVLTNLRGFTYKPSVLNSHAERLMELLDKSCKLNSLTLLHCNLIEVPPKLLARVFNKLECLNLSWSGDTMSEEQTKEVFRVMSSGTCLKKFDFIEFVDHIEKVDPVILAKALNNLEFLRVDFPSPITLPQILAIFKQLNVKTRIKAIVRYPPYEDLMGDDEFLYL